MQDNFREPIIKVGAKLPLHDFTFQVAVGGGQYANLRLQLGVPSDAACFAGFEKSEQLRLEFDVQFADFIEKERPAGGVFHQSFACLVGAGVSPFLRAEQLGFHELLRNRSAIDGYKSAARGGDVERVGHALFSNAGFAQDEDAGHGWAETFDRLPQRFHGR